METVLTVFIDGLKPESIEYMPFLGTLTTKKKIKTELGYSVTCHASMYSSVHPNKHLRWFLWKYSPQTSPCKWIKRLRIDKSPQNFLIRYALYKIIRFLDQSTSYYKMPLLWSIPQKYWHFFDMTEKKFWNEPGFLENYPTIFDILRDNKITYETVGMVKKNTEKSSNIIKNYNFSKINTWTYLFVGDIDPMSHKYGQDSYIVRKKLSEIDTILEKKYQLFEKNNGDFYFMLFSDHGHIKVQKDVDLKSLFRSVGKSLDDYIHFIDSNYARFWFRNKKEEKNVTRIFLDLQDKGFILTNKDLKKYHVNMPDNRYGDLIFYLDAPYRLSHAANIFGRKLESKIVSAHGYLPDHKDSDGVFISNKKIINTSYIELVDITPSILHALDLEIPKYTDGKSLWI